MAVLTIPLFAVKMSLPFPEVSPLGVIEKLQGLVVEEVVMDSKNCTAPETLTCEQLMTESTSERVTNKGAPPSSSLKLRAD
jgi:hypothetical protein